MYRYACGFVCMYTCIHYIRYYKYRNRLIDVKRYMLFQSFYRDFLFLKL